MKEKSKASCIKSLYEKYEEIIIYLFFGATTTLLNFLLSLLFWYALSWDKWYINDFAFGVFLGNLIAIVIAMIYAYIVNRKWVFKSQIHDVQGVFREFLRFVLGRLITLVVEVGGVQLVVWLFPGKSLILVIGKLFVQALVVILNFIFGKFFAFKKT